MGGKEPAVPVEFLGIAATNDGSEISARSGASFEAGLDQAGAGAGRPAV